MKNTKKKSKQNVEKTFKKTHKNGKITFKHIYFDQIHVSDYTNAKWKTPNPQTKSTVSNILLIKLSFDQKSTTCRLPLNMPFNSRSAKIVPLNEKMQISVQITTKYATEYVETIKYH